MGLPVHDKPDSAEICFVPGNDYRAFLAERLPQAARRHRRHQGGAVVGQHAGRRRLHHRPAQGHRRLRRASASSRPSTPSCNLVTIGDEDDLFSRHLVADSLSWVDGEPAGAFRCEVKVRYKSPPVAALVRLHDDIAAVEFERSVRAITPGQAAVFYAGERVIGGGVISHARPWAKTALNESVGGRVSAAILR